MECFDLFALPRELVDDIFRMLSLRASIAADHLMISKTWSGTLWGVQSDINLTHKYNSDSNYHLLRPANIKTLRSSETTKIDAKILAFFNLEKMLVDSIDRNALEMCAKLTALSALFSTGPQFSNEDLAYVGDNLTCLTSLNLLFLRKVNSWPNLSNLVKLRFLSLPRNTLTQEFYENIWLNTNVTTLNLNFNRITKKGMAGICKLTQLRVLSLSKLSGQAEPADTWVHLTNLTNLNSLICHIPKDAAHLISKLENLTLFNVHPEEFNATVDMNVYSRLTAIEYVDTGFSFTKFPTTWTNLTCLVANNAKINSDMKFDTLTRLKSLSAPLAPSACSNLKLLTNLDSLALVDREDYITYTDLRPVVSDCIQLSYLRIVADSTCADVISTMTNLTWLEIFCKANDSWPEAEIYKLTALRGLKRVVLNMVSKPAGIEELLLGMETNA